MSTITSYQDLEVDILFNALYNRVAERAAAKVYAKFTDEKKEKKESTFKRLLKNPDDFIMTAWVENDEVKISFKLKPEDDIYGKNGKI